MTKKVEQP